MGEVAFQSDRLGTYGDVLVDVGKEMVGSSLRLINNVGKKLSKILIKAPKRLDIVEI